MLTNQPLTLFSGNKLLSYILVSSLDPTDASNFGARPRLSLQDPIVIFLAGFSIMWMKKAGSGFSFSSLKSPKTLWLAVAPNTPWEMQIYTKNCGFWNFLSTNLKERREFSQLVGLDMQEKIAVLLVLLSVVQNYLLRLSVFVDGLGHHFVD